MRLRTKKERIEKFGTDDFKVYVVNEAGKGLDFAGELTQKHPWIKYAPIILIPLIIIILFLLVWFIKWFGGVLFG